MGVLTAVTSLPYLLIGLQAGAVADRMRRHRPVMVACEVISAVAMATIPVAWIAGLLTVPWLIAMAFVVGACSVIFRAFNFPHLVTVVHESQRTEALAGFQSAFALASVGGPGLAGLLVQLITAPFALLADAVSFLVSAFLIRRIAAPEIHTPAPRAACGSRSAKVCTRWSGIRRSARSAAAESRSTSSAACTWRCSCSTPST
ncbi:MFS transporter [Streptosporangium lutulentum]